MQQRLGMLIPLLTSPILPLWVKLCTEGDLRLPPALCAIATLAVTLSQPVLAVTLSHSALCTVPALLEAAPCALWSSPGRATSQSLHKDTEMALGDLLALPEQLHGGRERKIIFPSKGDHIISCQPSRFCLA